MVLDAAFGRLGLAEIVTFTAGSNLRSQAIMRRLGFRADSARGFDHPRLPKGHPLRRHVFCVLTNSQFGRIVPAMPDPKVSTSRADERFVVEIVSDLICPWCYIGKRRLERAAKLLVGRKFEIVWKPFQLNPGMPLEGMDRREYRTRKFGSWERSQALDAQVTAAAAEVGLVFAFEKLARTPNTQPGHLLMWLAGTKGGQDALAEKLFRAYFEEGRDVGDATVLSEIGASVGLQREDIAAALEGKAGAAEVTAEENALRRLGIQAVPAFLANGEILASGAQPEEILAELLEDAFVGMSRAKDLNSISNR